mgnify:CR=1 FL=1
MSGVALILYILFLLGYGAFLWIALWHLRAYRVAQSGNDRVSGIILACVGLLLFVSLLLFFQVPWQSYSLFPSSIR